MPDGHSSSYVETCDEVIGSSVGLLSDASSALRNALGTEHTHPGAWSEVRSCARDLAFAAERVEAEAEGKR